MLDANLLIYAYDEQSIFHPVARRWLEELFTSGVQVGLPLQSVLAFIRITTNPSLNAGAISVARSLEIIDGWLSLPNVRMVHTGPSHWEIFRNICLQTKVTGKLSTDIHLAALAIEHDAVFLSADRDFARFPGLRCQNPLASE